MILNISRAKSLMACPRYLFNRYHRKLEGGRSLNLIDGGAFHKGIAVGQATKDWKAAYVAAEKLFSKDFEAAGLMPEEEFVKADHADLVAEMLKCYELAFKDHDYTVIQPECEFDIAIPHTLHPDITIHHLEEDSNGFWQEKWGMPSPQAILEYRIASPHAGSHRQFITRGTETDPKMCPCVQPHRLVGKTDGIIQWGGFIWLQEHKTTAIEGEQFWQQWQIDIQLTGYLYGVGKALGIQPHGVILNAINKPSEKQVSAWNHKRKYGPNKTVKDYIRYERDLFTRTDDQLSRFEMQFVQLCNNYEQRITQGDFPMHNIQSHCFSYNRKCDYLGLCLNGDQEIDIESMSICEEDYVEKAREQVLVQIGVKQPCPSL